MAEVSYDALRRDLRDAIGRDAIYLGASGEERHFDPITLGAGYGAALILAFVAAAGQATGTVLWKRLAPMFANTRRSIADAEADQLAQIKTADDAIKLAAEELTGQYLEDFIRSGTEALNQRLISDNFPPEKARRIAESIAEIVALRAKL